ncbi:MAG: hypothetical protein QM808_01140 [Steroidobacteraceae bacterium]
MASFAPLHTGQFIVKPRTLRHRRRWLVAVLLACAAIPYVTFELGRMRGGYSVVSSQRERLSQSARIDDLQDEVTGLRRELSSVRVGRKVDQESTDSMQQSLAQLQATIQQQQEELAFYKAIVTPAAGASIEPQVQRFEVQSETANRYRLQLVLIQPTQAVGNAQGIVQIQLSGTRNGQPAVLPLAELSSDKSASLKFSYRYFQTLEQLIELPADFQPQSVQVELHAAQHAVQRQDFPWQPRAI